MVKVAETETTRVRFKVGPHEFEAEGPRDVVAVHFQEWKQLIAGRPFNEGAAGPLGAAPAVAGDLRELFVADKWRHLITLRVAPTGNRRLADAALLILYGYQQCLGVDGQDVPATRLKEALNGSGHRRERIDRTLAAYVAARLLTKTGRRKGTVYELTPEGVQRAEKLARALYPTLRAP